MIGELRDAPQVLQQWDILAPADGGYRFRVELLRRWIAENKPLSRTQEELDRINPVAENFFAAARGLYLDSQLEQAEEALRRCLNLNPNHLRAHELLAEILMARGDLDEAQVWLEKLDEIAPGRARFRLKQLYLQRAESEADDATKLAWYKKILKMFPDDPLVNEYRRRIEIPMILNEVRELEARHAYSEALERLRALESLYPAEKDWQPELERLQAKVLMSEKYRQALEALSSGDHSRASQMLAEVIAIDPSYQDAARYLYLAVRGKDPELPLGKLLLSSTASPLQSNRLAYFLIFWPAILPLLGLGLGLIPGQDLAWPPQTYMLWAITAFIWLVLRSLLAGTFRKWLCNWFGDYINIIAGAVSGLILAIIAAIITISGRGIMTNIAVGFSVTAAFTGAVIINRNSTDTGVRVSGVVAACGTPVAILVSSIVGISGGGALEIALICVLVGLTTGIILRDVILWESIIAGISIGIIIGGLVGLSSGNWMADTWEQRLISILGGSAVCIAATAVSFGLYVILDALDIKPPIPLGVILLIVSWLALIFITLGGLAWLQTGIWPQPVWPFG
jgi:tetratricopeptide (TPR) repeat protein